MSNIYAAGYGYQYKIAGDDHSYAVIRIFPDEDLMPGISTQKADAMVRAYNPNLRLDDKWKELSRLDGSLRCWARVYTDAEH